MQKKFRAALLFLLLLTLLAGISAPALAAAPTDVHITTSWDVGSFLEREEAGVDAIFDMADGSKLPLTSIVWPAGVSQRVRWSSSNTKIATVSSSGVMTARKRGVVTISVAVRQDSSITDQYKVLIVNSNLPDRITLNASSLSLYRFDTFQLKPTVTPAAAKQTVAYKSSSSAVSVSKTGLITAKKKGSATITCYSTADKSILATVKVTVSQKANPDSILLTPLDSALVVGDTLKLNAAPYPSTACEHFTFKSSSSRIATVDQNGLVTAKKPGKVTITVTSQQNSRIRVKRTLVVVSPDSPLYILPQLNELNVVTGSMTPIAATAYPTGKSQRFTYKSSSTRVLTVSSDGLITAKKAGTATVTITSAVNKDITAQVKVTVRDLPTPTAISISTSASSLKIGSTLQLFATASPAGCNSNVTWKSSNTTIAAISSTGLVTAKKPGVVTLTATSVKSSKVYATLRLAVFHPDAPTSITLPTAALTLEPSQIYTLVPTTLPAKAPTGVSFSSSSTSVATVSSSGVITAKKSGRAVITVTSVYNPNVSASVLVAVVSRATPSSLSASLSSPMLLVGETGQVNVAPIPASASRLFSFTSSSSTIASVSSDGVITAKKPGTVTITVKSKKNTAIKASFTLKVYTNDTPRSLTLSTGSITLPDGSQAQLTATVLPANAYQVVSFSSSDPNVATVSPTGLISAQGPGSATITCRTGKGNLTAACRVQVLNAQLSTVIPARTTDIAGIPENLAKIDALRKSAIYQTDVLRSAGKITSNEANVRKQIINRAFEMQAFPWMTLKTQEYWSKAYAHKRYLPGYVYYGLPYIQTSASGTYLNRRYNAEKALSEGRYTDTGYGYYMLNQKKLLENMYCGNDCSAFVSMSQWGTAHTASYLNTTGMAGSSYYKRLSSYSELRPGDFLLKSGDHTVLFLYFTNSAKTKMMIIEQGGNGNTVICSEFDVSYFQNRGFKAYRRASFS